jgi:peptide/nickel transport system substrate-binding protein
MPSTQPPTQTSTSQPPTQTTTTQPPSGAAPTGTIRIANADFGPEGFDPNNTVNVWTWYVCDRLLTQDSTGKVVGNLASYDFDPDTGIWTFHVPQGVKFHNGDPLTAEDVKFSIDRFGDPSSTNPWSRFIGTGYNKIETKVIDDYTVQFIPDHPELQQGIVFCQVMILPKNYFESMGVDGYNKDPIGTGPWKFVSLVPKTKLTLEANTDYWGKVPAYKNLVEQMVPEQSTRIAMLKSGDVDMVFPQTGIDFDRIAELEQQGFRTVDLGLPSSYSMAMGQGDWLPGAGPISDIRVRQAMSYALNRQQISDTWFQGYAKPGAQFFMHQGGNGIPPCFGWSDDLLPEPYDLAKAKDLLAQAGYPDNWADPTIHLYCPPTYQDFMQVLIGYWQAAGIQMKLEVEDLSVYYGMLFSRPAEGDPNVGWMWPWTSPDPFNCTYHSANMYTTWGIHGTSNDEKATQMYNDYLKITDPAASEQAWNEFQKYVKTLYINEGIVEIAPVYVAGPDLGDFTGPTWMSNQEAITGVQHP